MSDYLVKQSYGCMRHFCHNSSGICFCTMTDAHTTEYDVLLEGGQSDYDVLIDDSDTIHLICQNSQGDIIYLKNEEQDWRKYTLLKSKSPSAYPKDFRNLRVGNWISIIYAVDYKGKRLLSHHILENSDVPNAIDYAVGEFACTRDEYGNIYLFYTNSAGVSGWRRFIWSRKEWSEFTSAAANGNIKNPHIYVNEKVHIAAVAEGNVVYISGGDEKMLAEEGTCPIILKNEASLYIMWKSMRDQRVWASLSNDNGSTFQRPTEFMAGRFAPVKLFGLACTSFEQYDARQCYGYIKDNTISLFLLGNFMRISRTPPKAVVPEVKKDADIGLTKMKIQLQQMSDTMSKMEFRLGMLEKLIKEMDTGGN